MMALLKEKASELKSANKKLTKLEEKTVGLIKTNKGMKADWEVFQMFLKEVFHPSLHSEVLLTED